MTEAEYNAIIQELAVQRNSLGDRALNLAAQVAVKDARIVELEKELAALKNPAENVVEMPTRG